METQKKEMINKIRISADISSNDNPSNYDFGSMVKIKSGDDVVFEFLLLNGGNLIDTSQIQALTLEVLDIGCLNAPEPRSVKLLASKTLSADKIIALDSVDDFKTGKYNVSFAFSSQESNWGNGHKWIVLTGYSVDGSKTTFTQGWVETFARYSAEDEILPEVQSPFIRKEYADALYLNAQANLADVSDVSEARSNLGVYSYSEVADLLCQSEDNVLSEINSVSQDVQNNSANISSLAVAKANRGEFWFECGALTTTNKMPLNTPFSCVWTMAMTQEEFLQHKTFFPKFIGNLGYWSDAGYGWCINRIGNTLIGVGANNGGGSEKYNTLDVVNYLDGNPHIWTVVYNGTNISLYIDNVKKTSFTYTFESSESTNPLGVGSTPTSTTQNYGVWGKIYRIKYFNFDMSTDDAPYTIADYISGKDESPLLQGSQPVFDWKRVPTTATLVGNKLSFETSTTSQSYVYPLGETTQLKRGKTYILKGVSNVITGFYADKTSGANTCNVSWQTINKTTSTVSTGSATNFYNPIMPFVNGEDVEFTIVFTPLVDGMIIFTYFPVGTIGYLEFYSAEQVRALLSLDDVKSGVQVLDKSGNGNHANISGVVYASKENNPARCVDSASFSWAGTATTQKFANSDVAIPANSKVVAYAKASVGMSASFTCGSNSAVSKELSANTLTEIGSFLNASQGAFKVTPSSAITGKMDVYLTIEKF